MRGTHSGQVCPCDTMVAVFRFARPAVLLPVFITLLVVPAYGSDEDFRVFTERPRLLLNARRIRLLKRERERNSQRWQQFAALIGGGASFPEPAFARALYYAVSGDATVGNQAAESAVAPSASLREAAVVIDWCADLLPTEMKTKLVGRVKTAAEPPGDGSFRSARDRVFAAIAIASYHPAAAEAILRDVIQRWWRKDTAPRLIAGSLAPPPVDLQALYELLHAVADNLRLDLREDAPDWFQGLPTWHVLSHYPAPYQGTDYDFFVPAYAGHGDPDPTTAIRSRAAGLSMVAFDTNSQDAQFLQGWLMLDRMAMRSPLGAPYEFLWANPYLPGLSFRHMQRLFHDAATGRFALRSTWDEDATWIGNASGQWQVFSDGRVSPLNLKAPPAAVDGGPFRILFGEPNSLLRFGEGDLGFILLGLEPNGHYSVQRGTDPAADIAADRYGTLALTPSSHSPGPVRVIAASKTKKRGR